MVGWLRARWQNVVAGLWFRPGLVALGFVGLAVLLVEIDRLAGPEGVGAGFAGDAAAVRGILEAIAASLVTVAVLALTLTIVTLQLVSGQFTPRAMRGFLADRVTQTVVGVLIGIIAFCLVVLRAVRGETAGDGRLVPSLSVAVAIALALAAVGAIIVFIHHVSQTIQVSNIAARVARETLAGIDRLHPDPFTPLAGQAEAAALANWRADGAGATCRLDRPGYVQVVAAHELAAELERAGLRAHVHVAPGSFVTESTPAAELWPPGEVDDRARGVVRRFVVVASERDHRQDLGFGLRQLADVALRAISPGINDPTTAVTCIGYLRAALERLAARADGPQGVRAAGGEIVVVAERAGFSSHLETAFAEIGRYGSRDARVAGAVLDALAAVAGEARDVGATARLAEAVAMARRVAGPALEDARTDADRAALAASLARVEAVAAS